jgi:hypothetical protein
MRIQKYFPLFTRALAIVGVIAIIAALVMGLMSLNQNISTTASSYGGKGGGVEMRTESVSFDQKLSYAPPELLNDGSTNIEQKVIMTGSLSLIVDDAVESARAIRVLTEGKKGFVQTSSINELEDGTHYGYVTLRVPSNVFEVGMSELKEMAVVVESESVSSSDVTEQYIDLSARLKNAKAQEIRYVEILDVAKTVEEILQIETALANVRGYIESLTGQIQYLDSQTDMSSITVTLSEEPAIKIGGKVFRPLTSIKQAAQAVVSIAQWLVIAIIWIVIVGVSIGAPVAIVGWGGRKIYRRIRK